MTEMQAAMGLVQLGKLPTVLDRKRANAAKLGARIEEIAGVQAPVVRPECDPTFMLYTLLVERGRDGLRASMREAGIETRVYFPPAHLQPVFAEHRTDLPVTEEVAGRILSVPMHAQLGTEDIDA